jgi:hypothetical protein
LIKESFSCGPLFSPTDSLHKESGLRESYSPRSSYGLGESFHRSDYTIDCNSDAYEAYAVVAIVFIFIYPIGVPACFGALLLWNRDVLGGNLSGGQHANKWWYGDGETLDFLVDGYRAETFWFEEVEFLRKLLMAGARSSV